MVAPSNGFDLSPRAEMKCTLGKGAVNLAAWNLRFGLEAWTTIGERVQFLGDKISLDLFIATIA